MMTGVEKALQAAQGYLELDMPKEAQSELDSIPAAERNAAEVVHVEVLVALKKRGWNLALETAYRLCELEPESPSGFIHAAFCLHELGRTIEARGVLLGGPESLREEATYFYNLGCYATQLGELDEAQELLNRAFKMDAKLQELARTDPDLDALRT